MTLITEVYTTPAQRLGAARSALLVVDMQNDFCAEGGFVSKLGRDTGIFIDLAHKVSALIDQARAAGKPVIWLAANYDDADVSRQMLTRQRETGLPVCCAAGSWGADFFMVSPAPDEPVIFKHTYSGFFGTDLEAMLHALEIDTLVYAGVQTNICIESTLREGHSRGFYTVVASDCVASHMEAEHHSTLATVRFLLGDVLPAEEIVAHWNAQPEREVA